jgi:NAD(P)-dependent dehydrogenase (short-subunit alcohol dehydrogenase family)
VLRIEVRSTNHSGETKILGDALVAAKPAQHDTTRRQSCDPDLVAMLEQNIPLGRAGTPDEAAEAVYSLCAPQSNYISGQVVVCSGGISI